jgi:hypothetical protein
MLLDNGCPDTLCGFEIFESHTLANLQKEHLYLKDLCIDDLIRYRNRDGGIHELELLLITSTFHCN